MMNTKGRDAVFELVVLKGKKGQPEDGSADHLFEIAAGGDDPKHGVDQEDKNLDLATDKKLDHKPNPVPFFNTAPKSSPKDLPERKPPHTLKAAIFIIALVLMLFLGLITGLSLASVNRSQLTELDHNAVVDKNTYQMIQTRFQGMLSEMREEMTSQNQTVLELSRRLELLSQELNKTRSAVEERINATQGEMDSQDNRLTEMAGSLANNTRRLCALEDSGQRFYLRLIDLNETSLDSSMDLASAIRTLRADISSPVDVFGNCNTSIGNNTLSFSTNGSTNGSAQSYRIQTPLLNVVRGNRILDTRCLASSDGMSLDFVESVHLETTPDGGLRCVCSVAPPLIPNGTHSIEDNQISCEMHYTICPISQQLFSLV